MSKKKNWLRFGFERDKPFSWVIPILMAGFIVPLIITMILYAIYV